MPGRIAIAKCGKSFRSDATHIYDLRDGKVTKFRQFADTKVIWDALPFDTKYKEKE